VTPQAISDIIGDNSMFNILKYYADPDFVADQVDSLRED
jgi:hypothetical protein